MAHRVLRYKIVHAENLHYLCKHLFLLARTPASFLRAAPTGAPSPGPGNRSLMEVSQKLNMECIRAISYKVLSTYPTSLESKGTDLFSVNRIGHSKFVHTAETQHNSWRCRGQRMIGRQINFGSGVPQRHALPALLSKSNSSLTGTLSVLAIRSRLSNLGPKTPRSILLMDSTVKPVSVANCSCVIPACRLRN